MRDRWLELARRAGVDDEAIAAAAGNVREAIVNRYRKPTGSYDMAAAARDISRLPAIDRRLRALWRPMRVVTTDKTQSKD